MLQKLIPPTHVYSDVCRCYIRQGSERDARRLVKLHESGHLTMVLTMQMGLESATPLTAVPARSLRSALRDVCDAMFID